MSPPLTFYLFFFHLPLGYELRLRHKCGYLPKSARIDTNIATFLFVKRIVLHLFNSVNQIEVMTKRIGNEIPFVFK